MFRAPYTSTWGGIRIPLVPDEFLPKTFLPNLRAPAIKALLDPIASPSAFHEQKWPRCLFYSFSNILVKVNCSWPNHLSSSLFPTFPVLFCSGGPRSFGHALRYRQIQRSFERTSPHLLQMIPLKAPDRLSKTC